MRGFPRGFRVSFAPLVLTVEDGFKIGGFRRIVARADRGGLRLDEEFQQGVQPITRRGW